MSGRTRIIDAIVDKLKTIDGTGIYKTNLHGNVFNRIKFYDEIQDYPTVCVVAGYENREYHPSDFTWGFLAVSLKVYVEGENSQELLENTIGDIEQCIHNNEQLIYDSGAGERTAEILVVSIQTDEGVLNPIGVGEINLTVRYEIIRR